MHSLHRGLPLGAEARYGLYPNPLKCGEPRVQQLKSATTMTAVHHLNQGRRLSARETRGRGKRRECYDLNVYRGYVLG